MLVNGQDMEITSDGYASAPRLAADQLTVGWLRGQHERVQDVTQLVPYQLVLYRNNQPHREFRGAEGQMIWDWRFLQDSRCALATGSALRGISFYELWDISTGQLLETRKSPGWLDADAKPKWAAGLADY